MLESLQQESHPVDSLLFVPAQLGMTAAGVLVWVPGLLWLLRSPEAARVRALGFAYLALVAVFVATSAKPYYAAGIYPALMAAGGVAWERRGPRITLPVTALAVGGVLALPFALPVVPAHWADDVPVEDLEIEFGAQLGWEHLADEVAATLSTLPPAQREKTVILTRNYGESGALRLYGDERGLPPVFSGHNNEWLWGPPPIDEPGPVVLVGRMPHDVRDAFAACTETWRFETPHGVASEEEGAPVTLCRRRLAGWDELWPRLRSYRA
jgi:hypothetical protein